MTGVRRLAHELTGLCRVLEPARFAEYLGAVALNANRIRASRTLTAADRALRGPVSFAVAGARFELDCSALDTELAFDSSSAFSLARELYARDVYLRAFRPFDAAGRSVVDLGGNRGLFTLLAAAALRPVRIVYVEPDTRYLEVMRALTGPFAATEVVAHRGFAGRRPEGAEAPVVDLDRLLEREQIAFLKLDIEGAEETLFTEAGAWLDKVERIAMESHPLWCRTAAVVEALQSRGFTVFPADPVGRRSAPDRAEFIYAARDAAWLKPSYQFPSA